MAKAESLVVTDLRVELALYNRNMSQAEKLAGNLDKRLLNLIVTVNRAETALNKLGKKKIDVAVQVDSGAVDRAESDINALDNLSPKIDVQVNVDEEQAQSELKGLTAPKLEVEVSVDDEGAQTELDSITAPDLRVMVTADEEQAQTELNSLTAPDLKVKATADLSNVEKQLNDIRNLAKIQLVFDVAGAGLNVAQNVQNLPIVSGAQELNTALKSLQATTGQVIPDAENLINNVFASGNWGASREEVAGVIGELAKFPELAGDLETSAVTAFQIMQTTGTDFEGTLDAMRVLVANGLVPDVQSAGDLIVDTFQRGGDVAGDAIDSIREYSSQFAKAGIDGAAAMDLIIQGLQGGTRNGDALADMFKELNLKLTAAVDEGAGTEFDALTAAGLIDEAEAVKAGEMTGLQFAQAAQQALKDGLATEQNLFDAMGTQLEDFGIDIFKNLDFDAAAAALIPEGVAAEAATLLKDNLGAAFQNVGRVLETSVINKLKAAGVDINTFLQGATDKLYKIAELISSGVAFPEAIAIALDNPELGEQLRTLEALLGNFILELTTAVANIGEGLGLDVSGIRDFVADAGTRQLAYDISVAPDDMANVEFAIQQALRRGVDSDIIGEQVARAGQALIDRGDLEGAQQLLETVEAIPAAYAKFTAAARGLGGGTEDIIIPLSPEIVDDPAAIQAKVDAALAEVGDQGGYIIGLSGVEIEAAPAVDTSALEGLLFGANSDLGTAANDWMADLVDFASTNLKPPLSDADAVNLAAGALATGDMATALDAAARAGWPISEENLASIGEAGDNFYDLHNKLTEYTTGLTDAERDGTAAMQTLVSEGIDPAIDAQDLLTDGASLYVLGLADQLELAKVAWQSYADYVNNDLEINPPNGVTPPSGGGAGVTIGGEADGGVVAPGRTSWVGELGPELARSDAAFSVLNNVSSEALFAGVQAALHGGSGGTTVYNDNRVVNVAMTNNNQSGAQRMGSDIRFLNQVRGSV